jgi:Prophage CP4-57 regulatory protein (AlpA)
MPFVRFKYLKEQGIVSDRMAVARAIERDGFPKPLALGANTIAWDLTEVNAWLASRPRRMPKTGSTKNVAHGISGLKPGCAT